MTQAQPSFGGIIFPLQGVVPYAYAGTEFEPFVQGSAVSASTLALAANTFTTIIAGIAGIRVVVLHVVLAALAACELNLRGTGAAANRFDAFVAANTPVAFDYRPGGWPYSGALGVGVDILSSVATTVSWTILYLSQQETL